jgi:DNA topoisomerase-3
MLYDLTALQREANSRFGFTAKRTLAAAQGCYDRHKVLTYPRTNSRFLSTDLIPSLRSVAGHVGRAAPEYAKPAAYVQGLEKLPLGRVVNDDKVGDHHAIIPTDERPDLAALSSDERRIYDMVGPALPGRLPSPGALRADRGLDGGGRGAVPLARQGADRRRLARRLRRGGRREKEKEKEKAEDDEGAEQDLPRLEDGQAVRCTAAEVLAKQTKPPARFSSRRSCAPWRRRASSSRTTSRPRP